MSAFGESVDVAAPTAAAAQQAATPAPAAVGVFAVAPSTAAAPASASTALVVATKVDLRRKPAWKNVEGFPDNSVKLEQRKLNNFADINSYAGSFIPKTYDLNPGGAVFRPLDCKGELGAGPVQRWKEMLREGMEVRKSTVPTTFNTKVRARPQASRRPPLPATAAIHVRSQSDLTRTHPLTAPCARAPCPSQHYDGLRAAELLADGHFVTQLGHLGGGKDYSLARGKQGFQNEPQAGETRTSDPMHALFDRYTAGKPAGGGQGSARGKASARNRTPRGGKRAQSASRSRQQRDFGADGASPFLRGSRSTEPLGAQSMRARSASPGSRSANSPLSAGGGAPAFGRDDAMGRDGQFSFWGGASGGASRERKPPGAAHEGEGMRNKRPAEHPRTRAAREAQDRALILARARGRSPTRWGPAGERKLSIQARPAWRNVTGFPSTTSVSEHRKLNPFADVNSYSSTRHVLAGPGFRPLDCKGQNGARPVQQWKEMLRGGASNN